MESDLPRARNTHVCAFYLLARDRGVFSQLYRQHFSVDSVCAIFLGEIELCNRLSIHTRHHRRYHYILSRLIYISNVYTRESLKRRFLRAT